MFYSIHESDVSDVIVYVVIAERLKQNNNKSINATKTILKPQASQPLLAFV